MPAAVCSDAEFIAVWLKEKSAPRVAAKLGVAAQNAARRRRHLEKKYDMTLETEDAYGRDPTPAFAPSVKMRNEVAIKDGAMVVFSDAHFWPGVVTAAFRGLLAVTKKLKPKIVIANGDVFDGARISRHDCHGWEILPSVSGELAAVQERMGEVQKVAGDARLMRTRGNHDQRFEKYLAKNAGEFRDIPGFKLSDHLPAWEESWSIFINEDVVCKHRLANGVHAAYNNAVKSGVSLVTGHLHSLKVTPWTDYNGTRYGVDTGTLADPDGPQFEYGEDNPANHRSGFAVLTFRAGLLLPPELCEVQHGRAWFRGEAVA